MSSRRAYLIEDAILVHLGPEWACEGLALVYIFVMDLKASFTLYAFKDYHLFLFLHDDCLSAYTII